MERGRQTGLAVVQVRLSTPTVFIRRRDAAFTLWLNAIVTALLTLDRRAAEDRGVNKGWITEELWTRGCEVRRANAKFEKFRGNGTKRRHCKLKDNESGFLLGEARRGKAKVEAER